MAGTDRDSGRLGVLKAALGLYGAGDYQNEVGGAHDDVGDAMPGVLAAFGSTTGFDMSAYSNSATLWKGGPPAPPAPPVPDTTAASGYVGSANTAVTDLSNGALNDITDTIRPQLVLADASYDALGAQPSVVSSDFCAQPTQTLRQGAG